MPYKVERLNGDENNAAIVIHVPSGYECRSYQEGASFEENAANAMRVLNKRLVERGIKR